MRKLAAILLVALGLSVPAQAQITIPNTFVTRTTISSSSVNQNFNELGTKALNRTTGIMTGQLTTQVVVPDGNNTRDFGAAGTRYANVYSVLGNFSGAVATGNLTVTGTAAVSGNVAVNTDKFTVAAATGNTLVAGTLAVSGAVDIASGLTAGSGDVAIIDGTGKIPALSSTYLANLSGTNLTGIALLGTANTYTAGNKFFTYGETVVAPAIGGAALTIDLSLGTAFNVALNADATVTISNPQANGTHGSFIIRFTADGTIRDLTWPASVVWPGGVEPTMTGTNGKRDIVMCVYSDGGTTYFCNYSQNF